ncbi:uncharacterized protein LOC116437998 isoform X2 [Corvus moneduloides]|uniref:uncharacterized protein LOC116437998 isoform X2 n=1 Tax=Corvus moneduloides TaxID=1196302 RepID=UPI001363FCD9|nr:uncharacterized protein LOC116437998 isoform X2 [Corvus moneduloides]
MNGKRKYLPRPSGTAPLAKILKEKEKQLQLQQRWSTCRMSWPWMLEGASLRCCCRPGRAKGQRRAGPQGRFRSLQSPMLPLFPESALPRQGAAVGRCVEASSSVECSQCSNPGTLPAAQLGNPGAGITLEPSEEAKPHTKKSLLECWPGFGRSQVAWSSEVFPVRNPCWGCFPWLSQGEGTALEFLQPQAGDASPENQFRIVHLTLSLTCGFQGAFWSSGYSQERIFHHLTFKPGIPNPHRSRGKLVKG